MRNFKYLLFVMEQSYIGYYTSTVPLIQCNASFVNKIFIESVAQ